MSWFRLIFTGNGRTDDENFGPQCKPISDKKMLSRNVYYSAYSFLLPPSSKFRPIFPIISLRKLTELVRVSAMELMDSQWLIKPMLLPISRCPSQTWTNTFITFAILNSLAMEVNLSIINSQITLPILSGSVHKKTSREFGFFKSN